MPQMRVAVWNIRNLGAGGDDLIRGNNGELLASVVRAFVADKQIDVLAVMEVFPTAQPTLESIRVALGAGWTYDWIRGSLEILATYPPLTNADLAWRGGPGSPRREGYALFWRTAPARFRVVPALRPVSEGTPPALGPVEHYLELVLQGLRFDNRTLRVETGYNPTGVVRLTNPFNRALGLAPWSDLGFPWVSKYFFNEARRELSRRPALAILELQRAGGDRARLCPLMFYHAPSQRQRADWGTYLAALSRQLNVTQALAGGRQDPFNSTRIDQSIIGGDFNLPLNPAAPRPTYLKFTAPYSDDVDTGGSGMDYVVPSDSTVQLNELRNGTYTGPTILRPNLTDYLFSPIDQLLYRGLAAVAASSEVSNIPQRLMASPSPYAVAFDRYALHLAAQVAIYRALDPRGPLDAAGDPVYGERGFNDWATFVAELAGRRFLTPRCAAEFYHIFVSDHLPVVLTFNF